MHTLSSETSPAVCPGAINLHRRHVLLVEYCTSTRNKTKQLEAILLSGRSRLNASPLPCTPSSAPHHRDSLCFSANMTPPVDGAADPVLVAISFAFLLTSVIFLIACILRRRSFRRTPAQLQDLPSFQLYRVGLRQPPPTLKQESLKVVFHVNEEHVKEDAAHEACAICMEPLEDHPVSAGECMHYMHNVCLSEWASKGYKRACPICRSPLHCEPSRRPEKTTHLGHASIVDEENPRVYG